MRSREMIYATQIQFYRWIAHAECQNGRRWFHFGWNPHVRSTSRV